MKMGLPMLDYSALSALAMVVREGSFERAVPALHVTPLAVSHGGSASPATAVRLAGYLETAC
jgi:hypothetical protein